ncbi:hypothetical protein GQ44DRAFT_620060, partial [Phaeosphaeriaceae sp. PMI808]
QAEQTNNGYYEFVEYHTFGAVKYERYMSWTAGSGSGRIGVGTTTLNTDKDTTDVLLSGGYQAVVVNTKLRLVRKT